MGAMIFDKGSQLKAWNRLQEQQAAERRERIYAYIKQAGMTGVTIREIVRDCQVTLYMAEQACRRMGAERMIETNGFMATMLRWGVKGIRAHSDAGIEERQKRATARRRERNRIYQANRHRKKEPPRPPVDDRSAIERLVQRVPASVWDLARI